jgi:hypothetical protein
MLHRLVYVFVKESSELSIPVVNPFWTCCLQL